MDFPERITIGEKYGPAMSIYTQVEADRYFGACVRHAMRKGMSREQAEDAERANILYYAGYFSEEIRRRNDDV
jgi:hypothetical protein